MPSTLNPLYGTTEGPLGFPLTDRQAIALDTILKALPRDEAFRYRKATVARGASEVLPGERSDVSWITTEDPDRTREVVRARGMNDSQFKLNPLVTLQHAYSLPPIGRSLWRKVVRDGAMQGVKAKTQYPAKPEGWEGTWPADVAFRLVQADLLRGKSIGFLPTRVHVPGETERQTNGWKDVDLVIDEWILLEYACTFLPAQQNAIVEAVSKSDIQLPDEFIKAMELDLVLPSLTFGARQTPSAEFKGAVAYEDTPRADKDTAWDGDAATARLREWSGIGGADLKSALQDAETRKKYARGFAYVSGDGMRLADYKLPHHDIQDGKLVVVYQGVVAALAAVNGARGGVKFDAAADKSKVYHHLARHYRQFGEEPPESKGDSLCMVDAVPVPHVTRFVPLEEIEKALLKQINKLDLPALANQVAQQVLDKARGRI
jgi:hypothetical protein